MLECQQPKLFEDEAKTLIGDLEISLLACVLKAEETWNAVCEAFPEVRIAARGRGRNALFNELVAENARNAFAGNDRVRLAEKYGSVRLFVHQSLDCGFKKVDKKGRSSSYPTKRHRRYINQMRLFGEPMQDAVRLHIGYQWNESATKILNVSIIYPQGRQPSWLYSIMSAASADAKPILIPTPQQVVATKSMFKSTLIEDKEVKKVGQ